MYEKFQEFSIRLKKGMGKKLKEYRSRFLKYSLLPRRYQIQKIDAI